jgi:hypothetical protein
MNRIHIRVRRPGMPSALKRAGPIAAALATALVLAPTASSGTYTDPTGDSGAAGDIAGVTVSSDKQSGQIIFRIAGTNLASSVLNPLFLTIDSDANPSTGDLTDHGSDYWFGMDEDTYGFQHWDGSDWVAAVDSTVRINGDTREIVISVNRSELGNTSSFNFVASTFFVLGSTRDDAPNDGAYNYTLEANGPRIDSVDMRTIPSSGPRAGRRFIVTPTGLKLPPDGRTTVTPPAPESYSCAATLAGRTLAGNGIGRCTFAIPKKARGKRLTVLLTVNYQGATKRFPFTFKVA